MVEIAKTPNATTLLHTVGSERDASDRKTKRRRVMAFKNGQVSAQIQRNRPSISPSGRASQFPIDAWPRRGPTRAVGGLIFDPRPGPKGLLQQKPTAALYIDIDPLVTGGPLRTLEFWWATPALYRILRNH